MIWYDMICYDMMWCDVMWYDMICYAMMWCDMIWYDISYDMIWYDISYDMICVYIYTVYIYTYINVEYVLECFPTPGKLQNSNKNPKWVAFYFSCRTSKKCPFRPASGIFFMASLTFPMDPKRSPKFGVAARRGSIGTSSSRPCAVEPQKAQRIALPAAQRARPRPKTPPRKPRAMVTRWKKDEYRNVVTCVFFTIVQVMYSDVLWYVVMKSSGITVFRGMLEPNHYAKSTVQFGANAAG